MPATPWSNSSSLISDRLPPRSPLPKLPSHQQQTGSRGKHSKAATPEPPKSQAIRALETRLNGIHGTNGRATKDPKGGCFCQARSHALSTDVPMCRSCGLILCKLNPAHHACPHCATSLLDEHARAALAKKLEGELALQLAQEEAARQKAIEDARAAEGAFPMLPGSRGQVQTQTQRDNTLGTPSPRATPPPPPATRTVLSLNSETGRVTLSSYSSPRVVTSGSASRVQDVEEGGRVPGPPVEVSYVKEPVDPGRPWRNVQAGDVRYVMPPGSTQTDKKTSKRRRKKKGEEQLGTVGTSQGH